MITPGIFKYLKKRSKGTYVHLETRKVHGTSEQRIDWDDSDTQPMGKAERQNYLSGKALTFYTKR